MSDRAKPIFLGDVPQLLPGSDIFKSYYDMYDADMGELMEESEGAAGMYGVMDWIFSWASGDIPEAVQKYGDLLTWASDYIKELPEKAQTMMEPFIWAMMDSGYAHMGKSAEFEALRPEYERLFDAMEGQAKVLNSDFNTLKADYKAQSAVLDKEYGRIKGEYQNQYNQASGPMTLNLGGTQMVIPNYNAVERLLKPQTEITTNQVDLMDKSLSGQSDITNKQTNLLDINSRNLMTNLTGQEGLIQSSSDAIGAATDSFSKAADIQSSLFNVYAGVPNAVMPFGEAAFNLAMTPFNMLFGLNYPMLGSASPGASGQTDWGPAIALGLNALAPYVFGGPDEGETTD